jgi:hypothetical protein
MGVFLAGSAVGKRGVSDAILESRIQRLANARSSPEMLLLTTLETPILE